MDMITMVSSPPAKACPWAWAARSHAGARQQRLEVLALTSGPRRRHRGLRADIAPGAAGAGGGGLIRLCRSTYHVVGSPYRRKTAALIVRPLTPAAPRRRWISVRLTARDVADDQATPRPALAWPVRWHPHASGDVAGRLVCQSRRACLLSVRYAITAGRGLWHLPAGAALVGCAPDR